MAASEAFMAANEVLMGSSFGLISHDPTKFLANPYNNGRLSCVGAARAVLRSLPEDYPDIPAFAAFPHNISGIHVDAAEINFSDRVIYTGHTPSFRKTTTQLGIGKIPMNWELGLFERQEEGFAYRPNGEGDYDLIVGRFYNAEKVMVDIAKKLWWYRGRIIRGRDGIFQKAVEQCMAYEL